MKTRHEKLKAQETKIHAKLWDLEKEKETKTEELKSYCKRHRLSWDDLESGDVKKLKKIYAFLDASFPIKWQGGLRGDDRGMALFFWLDDDPDYLIVHLTSTSENICFGGSTSWRAFAPTLEDKVALIKNIKKQFLTFIKEEG